MKLPSLLLIALAVIADTIASHWLSDALQYALFIIFVLLIILLILACQWRRERRRKE